MPFPYKTVLILGATSGIGLALAEKLITNGSYVIAVGCSQENLDSLLKKHGSSKVSTESFDITDLKAIPNVTKAHPKLDSVVLNSGIQRCLDFLKPESIDLSVLDTEFITNYTSYLHLTVAVLPFLQSQSIPTSLVYVSSVLALILVPRCGNYCASKAALHKLILGMREQLRGSNVKVIEVIPPAVQTELHDAKHQPDIKDGVKLGMPLDEFMSETWVGLDAEDEQIPVGMSKVMYEAWEGKRQDQFQGLMKMMAGKT